MTAGTTGRRRSVSLMTASRYSPSVPWRPDLLDQAVEHGRVAYEALQRPGQRGRGRLVPGDEQRHQLVAQLLVGHRRAVLVARLQEQREHVVALGRRRGAALADLLVEDLVGGRGGGAKARPRAPVAVPAHAEGEGEHAPTRGGDVEDLAQGGAQRVEAGRVLDPEYRAHDHLERDGLGVREDGERLAHRPARHLALGRLSHDLRRRRPSALRGTGAGAACAGACARRRRAAAPSRSRAGARARCFPRRRGAGSDRR